MTPRETARRRPLAKHRYERLAPGLGTPHPDRDHNDAIARAIFERLAGTGELPAIRHTVQVTSFGGSGTTSLCEHLAGAGVDLPQTPGHFPFKHQRVAPRADEVPAGFRVVYLVGDPRNAVMSVFGRGFQGGHYLGMRLEAPSAEVDARLRTLESFLEAGVDDFELEDHVDRWLGSGDRGYPIVVARFEALPRAWPTIGRVVGLAPDAPGLASLARQSDWRALPRRMRRQVDRMYGDLARRIEALPPAQIVGGTATPRNAEDLA